ncbi:Protein RUBCNL-like [Camelus dromedarius]|uniref:Protein RUBCNL-like n=1 Tax=Camelus dromedarius TaxID=9838 RepID=A0A5N4D8M3_CAMDR|nr:Protein RUBCNL-like [Camelus dromedarius]KAB1267447.1 Protein RUBCNL-like [Camelus dromedarius]
MVSQFAGCRDSPEDPWEGVSDDPGDTDGSPSLLDTDHTSCQSDIRFMRHRAAWINPQCVQLQDLPSQVPAVGDSESHVVGDATSPRGPSLLSAGDSLVETSLLKGTADSTGSCSAQGSGEKSGDFSLTSAGERAVLPGRGPQTSLFTSPKILAASPGPEADSAFFKPSHLTAPADEGAVHVSGRNVPLNSFSPEAFVLPVDVEKENAHFYVADMIISIMEKMKCDILSQLHAESWSTGEAGGSLGNDQVDPEVTFYTNVKQESGSSTSSDSGYEGEHLVSALQSPDGSARVSQLNLVLQDPRSGPDRACFDWVSTAAQPLVAGEPGNVTWAIIPSEATHGEKRHVGCAVLQVSPVAETSTSYDVMQEDCKGDLDEFVIVELGEFSDITETCECSCGSSKSVVYEPNFNSAELLAKELYGEFRKCWVSSGVNHPLAGSLNPAGSVVVDEEHLGKDFESSMDILEEIKLKSRIRGTEDWAPPRFQIIFNVHPPLKRDLVVAAQNFLCAGCGTPIEPRFVKRLRYCEYLGRYFCDCCHSYEESCLPARVLRLWDFRKCYVSNFSKRLLDGIWHQPIFNLRNSSHSLYTKAKELDRVRELQEQLFHVKKLLKTCRFAESALQEFEQVPGHLTDELHLFSLEDLVRVKKGLLAPLLKDILKVSLAHVAGCEVSCVKERASFVNSAGAQLSSFHFRPRHVEDAQHAEPAFTSSASSPPSAPGVRGSERGEDFWKVCPPQRHDALSIARRTVHTPYDHVVCVYY